MGKVHFCRSFSGYHLIHLFQNWSQDIARVSSVTNGCQQLGICWCIILYTAQNRVLKHLSSDTCAPITVLYHLWLYGFHVPKDHLCDTAEDGVSILYTSTGRHSWLCCWCSTYILILVHVSTMLLSPSGLIRLGGSCGSTQSPIS